MKVYLLLMFRNNFAPQSKKRLSTFFCFGRALRRGVIKSFCFTFFKK
nr:MAG TPA: hypothetical protein [Inoviridae sp.]